MKHIILLLIFCVNVSAFSKEWKNLEYYRKMTHRQHLTARDWLKSDRLNQTEVWHEANIYNLVNIHPEDYLTIKQRRDFYAWYYLELDKKGHEVIWPKMAHFISNKLRLIHAFPYKYFTKKSIKNYANEGSQIVFIKSFPELKTLWESKHILKANKALEWDKKMLFNEQYLWIDQIYTTIDTISLKTIEQMAKGKGFYSLMVSKPIRFVGDISNSETRYNYAIDKLYVHCVNTYK